MGVVVVVLTIRLVVVMIVVLVVKHKKMQNSKEDAYDRVLHHFEPGGDNNFHKTINSGVGNTSEDGDDDGSIVEDNRGPTYDDVEQSTKESRHIFAFHPQQHVSTGTHTTTQPGGKTIGLGSLSTGYDDSFIDSQQYDAIVVHTTTQPGGKATGEGTISAEYDDQDTKTDSQQYDDVLTHTTTQPGGKQTDLGPISAEYDIVDHRTDSQQYDDVLSHTITQPGGKTDGLMPISAGYEDLDSGCTNTTPTITEQRTKTSHIGQVVYTVPDKSKKKKKKGKKPVMKRKE